MNEHKLFLLAVCLTMLLSTGCVAHGVKRTSINVTPFFRELGVNQAEIVEDVRRTVFISGQVAMDYESGEPQHVDDIRAQWNMVFDKLEAVLNEADMDLSDVVHFYIYTTDVKATLENWDVFTTRFAENTPTGNALHGVTELAFSGLMIEMSVIAMD